MRYLIALTFCFLLASPQADACGSAADNTTIFFKIISDPQPDADVIAEVSLSDVNDKNVLDATATATVLQVMKTSDTRVRQGAEIVIKYRESTCGPWLKNGDKGIIIARTGTDSRGSLVLCPYETLRKGGDGRVNTPRTSCPPK